MNLNGNKIVAKKSKMIIGINIQYPQRLLVVVVTKENEATKLSKSLPKIARPIIAKIT